MIRITKIRLLKNKVIHFNFSNGAEKSIDFTPFIKEDELSRLLADPKYFAQVRLYENGRGIYWPNGYDFCPDFLRHHLPDWKEMQTEKS